MTTPQLSSFTTHADALAAGCDTVQPKYDGRWCRCVIRRGIGHVYLPSGMSPCSFTAPEDVVCVLIGNLMTDNDVPPRIVVWDCWSIGQESEEVPRLEHMDLVKYSYRDRYAVAKQQISRIGNPLITITPNYPIRAAGELWSSNLPETRGLVYRRSDDPAEVTILVSRRYVELPGGMP